MPFINNWKPKLDEHRKECIGRNPKFEGWHDTSHYPGSRDPAPGGTQGHIYYNFKSMAEWIYFLTDRITSLEQLIKGDKMKNYGLFDRSNSTNPLRTFEGDALSHSENGFILIYDHLKLVSVIRLDDGQSVKEIPSV